MNIGSRSLADWIEMAPEVGADGTTFSSVSVALSSELPGPAVPGFQNCRVLMASVDQVAFTLRESRDDMYVTARDLTEFRDSDSSPSVRLSTIRDCFLSSPHHFVQASRTTEA